MVANYQGWEHPSRLIPHVAFLAQSGPSSASPNARYRHLADNPTAPAFVRYWSNSEHGFSKCWAGSLTLTSLFFAYDRFSFYCAIVSLFEVAADVPKPFRRDQC
jgi:hypothetical protein